jgi:hypothetical protein
MSKNDEELAEAIGWLLVIAIISFVMLWIAGIAITAGSAFGGGVSLYNYGLALKNNVKVEKPTI